MFSASLNQNPVYAGETRTRRISGNEWVNVGIRCFVNNPPPPKYKRVP